MSGIRLGAGSAPDGGAPAATLELRLFGPMEARVGSEPMPRLRTRRGLWLLALLALRAGRQVDRDWLTGTLWPESDEARGRRSFRQTLYDLRAALGAEAYRLEAEGSRTLRLELSGAFVDVLAFDAAVARSRTGPGELAALEGAVRLYRGPLLEDCAEEWALPERRQREQAYQAALAALAAAAMQRGEHDAAASALQLAVAADPYREDLQRALMEALAEGGSPAAALLVYREFRARLAREMAAEPSEETQQLFQRLRDATRARARPSHRPRPAAAAPAPPGTAPTPVPLPVPLTALVGREEEVDRLVALLGASRSGRAEEWKSGRSGPVVHSSTPPLFRSSARSAVSTAGSAWCRR